MQTLPAGSFLNLDSAEKVEALKFTARRLAEHTAQAVANDLDAASLENLSNSLWEKAEYVMRDTERRRLHQIFNENFCERFRQLKPEAAEAQTSECSAAPPAAETIEGGDREFSPIRENRSLPVSPEESAAVCEGKKDEFLGFVEPGESPGDAQPAESVTTANVLREPASAETPVNDKLADELLNAKIQSPAAVETPNPANHPSGASGASEPPTAENFTAAKTEATDLAAPAEIKPATMPASAAASAIKTTSNNAEAKEPFEFEKCTINLSLTLLPAEPGRHTRKIIVGAVSHNLPPEIDFLEIPEGEDLTKIANLVRDKLTRFRQILPVKYIEQLRAVKTKAVKKPEAAKNIAAAAPSQTAISQENGAKTSGEQKVRETEKRETAASAAPPIPIALQPVAPNNIQGSLF